MENFVLYDELGKANEQTIYKARRKGTIKYLAISCAERHRRPLISNHVRFVLVLSHRNVLQFHEWYETSNHLWLVMELCTGGSLEQVIKEDGYLPENVVRKFGADIVRGLQYIHSRGVIFNDTKPARFLLDGHGNVKLFDFSLAHLENESLDEVLARFSDEDEFNQHTSGDEYNRISPYTAPERLQNNVITSSSDYWGLGCLLYHMSCGSAPFSESSVDRLTDNILNHDFPPLKIPGKKPSITLSSLISSLLMKSPAKRITQSRLIRHEFWQSALKDLELCSTGETEETSSLSTQEKNYGTKNSKKQMTNGADHSLDLEPELLNASGTKGNTSADGMRKGNEDKGCKGTAATASTNATITTVTTTNPRLESLGLDAMSSSPQAEAANFTLHANYNAASVSPSSPRNQNRHDIQPDSQRSQPSAIEEEEEVWKPDQRMVQSEYNGLQSGLDFDNGTVSLTRAPSDLVNEMTSSIAQTISESKFAPQPVPVETRANLSLTYPWGDESPILPQDPKLVISLWNYLRGSFETQEKNDSHLQTFNTGWRPRPLNDYTRWTRATPPTRIEGLTSVLDEAKLRKLTVEEMERHIAEVLVIFRSHCSGTPDASIVRSASKTATSRVTSQQPARTHLLAYLIWLAASVTSYFSRTPLANFRPEQLKLVGVTAFPELFIECIRQLKTSGSVPADLRVGLCQLCSLLAHRIATVVFYHISYYNPHQSLQVAWKPIAANLPGCLSSLIEILREPSARTGHRLRQIALAALGEVLTCTLCLLGSSIREAEITGVREGVLVDVQSSQWQTAVHHMLRCLAPSSSNASSNVSASPGIGVTSALDNLDLNGGDARSNNIATAAPQAVAGNESSSADGTASTVRVSEAHVRLSAARSLDAVVTAVLGCRLHDVPVSGSLLASATACLQAITTTDVVRHLWTDGVVDLSATRQVTNVLQRNQLHQEISLSCASAMAGIVRINPSLFTTGLIDRIGSNSFVNVIEPPAGGPACQQTNLVARLLSMACTGLLVPLGTRPSNTSAVNKAKRTSVVGTGSLAQTRQPATGTGVGAGTPAACRRLLTDQRFMIAVFRHLKSPHAMLRAKSYLLCAAILATCPRDSFPLAFDAHLPAVLERDLKTTRGLQNRYLDAQLTVNTLFSTTDVTGAPALTYLAACSLHFADLLVLHLIPLICQQLLIALGCINSTSTTNVRGGGTSSTAVGRFNRAHSVTSSTRPGNLAQASSTSALNVVSATCNLTAARAWLPAVSCLAGLLNTCPSIRLRLLQLDTGAPFGSRENLDNSGSDFCLLAVLGRLLDLWASVDPISSAAGMAGVHQPGTTENQLLTVTLTITEDLSQQSELVESRRRDFICLILPGLARLAVAPGARPETRAICVKIVANLADILLGETGYSASTHSLNELRRLDEKSYTGASPYSGMVSFADRPLSADVELLLKELGHPSDLSRERTQSFSELLGPLPSDGSGDPMTQSQYTPSQNNSFISNIRSRFGLAGSTRPKRTEKARQTTKTLRAAVQPPTPDVLVSLFEMVNKLMIPYADQLILCSEVTAPTAFIRLLNILLGAVVALHPQSQPPSNSASSHTPTARGDCFSTDGEESRGPAVANRWVTLDQSARRLVRNIVAHGLDVAFVRLLASHLLNPADLDPAQTGKSQGSAASALCLALFHMVPLLLHWPRESRPSHWIIDLRLLELVTIACLELGDLMLPSSGDSVEGNEIRRTGSQPCTKSPKKLPPKHPSPKNASRSSRIRCPSSPLCRRLPLNQMHAAALQLHVPLLAGLEAMNALLNHVADVVRVALAARNANTEDSETAAMAAEEILVASRPPPSLAGFLSRLVGLWRPKSADASSQTAVAARTASCSGERVVEEEVCFQLCEAAITGLTNFASLYGGEYSRSALTPSAAASLSLGLLRLAEEDQKLQHERSQTTGGAKLGKGGADAGRGQHPSSNDYPAGLKQAAQLRRRLRLLLRIIKRLVFSDPTCRSMLAAEASEHGVSNLYTTLQFLGEQTQRNADASTAKLVREITDFVKPANRFTRDRSAASADERTESPHMRKTSDTRVASTTVS